jgi:hypothetical protein
MQRPDKTSSSVFIVCLKGFSVYYLAESSQIVSRLQADLVPAELNREQAQARCDRERGQLEDRG